MFWLDRNKYEGVLILYIDEKIPCKILTDHTMSITSEIIIMEFHQSKRKWLMHLKDFTQTFTLSCLITKAICHQSKIASFFNKQEKSL